MSGKSHKVQGRTSHPLVSSDVCWVATDDALADHDAVQLAELLRKGTLSPLELLDAAIARIERANPKIAAVSARDFERARARASNGGADGYFAGVPFVMKDQTRVAGLPLRLGSPALGAASPAAADSRMTTVVKDIGLNIFATSTMPEFGLTTSSDYFVGEPTRNPWGLAHTSCGSSSGSAALVAAGVLPMAHGGDGGGSIRVPAAACGIIGMKPSRYRIPHEQEGKLPLPISSYGVVSRTVRDQCAFYAAAEQVFVAPRLPPIGRVLHPVDRPLRIGVIETSPANLHPDPNVLETLRRTAGLLESLGHEVDQVDPASETIGEQFIADFTLYWAMLALTVRYGGTRWVDPSFDASKLTSFTLGLAGYARRRVHRIPGAIRRLKRFRGEGYTELLGGRDVILSPTLSAPAPRLEVMGHGLDFESHFDAMKRLACFTPIQNAAGAPGISLPIGHHPRSGLPIGMHLAAHVGQERLLLELALQVEAAQPFSYLGDRVACGEHS